MFRTISNAFYRWAKGWLILLLLVLEMFFAGFLMPLIQGMLQGGSGGIAPLDLMIFAGPDEIFSMIARYGDVTFYRNVELTVDILYPIVYTLFFSLAISWLFQRGFSPSNPVRRWNVLPLGAWFFDLLENLTIVALLSLYPMQPSALAWLLFVLTLVKFLFAGGSILLLLAGLVMAVKNRFQLQG